MLQCSYVSLLVLLVSFWHHMWKSFLNYDYLSQCLKINWLNESCECLYIPFSFSSFEVTRTLRCTTFPLSRNLSLPREYYIRKLCGVMFSVLLYRDRWFRLLPEFCVDMLRFFHAQWGVLWIRVLSGFWFLNFAPGLGRRIDIVYFSPRCSIAAANVRVLFCWFCFLPI